MDGRQRAPEKTRRRLHGPDPDGQTRGLFQGSGQLNRTLSQKPSLTLLRSGGEESALTDKCASFAFWDRLVRRVTLLLVSAALFCPLGPAMATDDGGLDQPAGQTSDRTAPKPGWNLLHWPQSREALLPNLHVWSATASMAVTASVADAQTWVRHPQPIAGEAPAAGTLVWVFAEPAHAGLPSLSEQEQFHPEAPFQLRGLLRSGSMQLFWSSPRFFSNRSPIPAGISLRTRVYQNEDPVALVDGNTFEYPLRTPGPFRFYVTSVVEGGGRQWESTRSEIIEVDAPSLLGPKAPFAFETPSIAVASTSLAAQPKLGVSSIEGVLYAHATFIRMGGGGTQDKVVYTRSSKAGKPGSFDKPRVLYTSTPGARIQEVALAVHGPELTVAWITEEPDNHRVQVQQSHDGGVSWRESFLEIRAGAAWKRGIDTAYDRSGGHHLVWGERNKAYYLRDLSGPPANVFDQNHSESTQETVKYLAYYAPDKTKCRCENCWCEESYQPTETTRTRTEERFVTSPSLHVDGEKVSIIARQTLMWDNLPVVNPLWARMMAQPVYSDRVTGDATPTRHVIGWQKTWKQAAEPGDEAQLGELGYRWQFLYEGTWHRQHRIQVAQHPLISDSWKTTPKWRIATVDVLDDVALWPSRPRLLTAPGGRLYAAYERGPSPDPSAPAPNAIALSFSEDGGKTWSEAKTVGRGHMPQVGATTQEIIVLYYKARDEEASELRPRGEIWASRSTDGNTFHQEALSGTLPSKALLKNAHTPHASRLEGVPTLAIYDELIMAGWVHDTGEAHNPTEALALARATRLPPERIEPTVAVSAEGDLTEGRATKFTFRLENQYHMAVSASATPSTVPDLFGPSQNPSASSQVRVNASDSSAPPSPVGLGRDHEAAKPPLYTAPPTDSGVHRGSAPTAADLGVDFLSSALHLAESTAVPSVGASFGPTLSQNEWPFPGAALATVWTVPGVLDESSIDLTQGQFVLPANIDGNDQRAVRLRNRLYNQEAGIQREFVHDAQNKDSEKLAAFERVWVYTQGIALDQAQAEDDRAKAKAMATWLCLEAKWDTERSTILGWHFSTNTRGDDWKDVRLVTGANAWAVHGLGTFLTSKTYRSMQDKAGQAFTKAEYLGCYQAALRGLMSMRTPSGLVAAGITAQELSVARTGTEYYAILDELGYGDQHTPIRAKNVVTEHNVDVLSVLNHALEHHAALGLDEGELRNWRDSLRHAIFTLLWDGEQKRIITGGHFDDANRFRPSPFSAIDNCSWLSLAVDVNSLDEDRTKKLAACLHYTIETFVKELGFSDAPQERRYLGTHYFPRDFRDPYIDLSEEEQKKQPRSYHVEATLGLILGLWRFADQNEGHPDAPYFSSVGQELWYWMQVFVQDHGFVYSSQRIQNLSTLLQSSTAAIWFIRTRDYEQQQRQSQDRPLGHYGNAASQSVAQVRNITREALEALTPWVSASTAIPETERGAPIESNPDGSSPLETAPGRNPAPSIRNQSWTLMALTHVGRQSDAEAVATELLDARAGAHADYNGQVDWPLLREDPSPKAYAVTDEVLAYYALTRFALLHRASPVRDQALTILAHALPTMTSKQVLNAAPQTQMLAFFLFEWAEGTFARRFSEKDFLRTELSQHAEAITEHPGQVLSFSDRVALGLFAIHEGMMDHGLSIVEQIMSPGSTASISERPGAASLFFQPSGQAFVLRAAGRFDPRFEELFWSHYAKHMRAVDRSSEKQARFLLAHAPLGVFGVEAGPHLWMPFSDAGLGGTALPSRAHTQEALHNLFAESLYALLASEPESYIFDHWVLRLHQIRFAQAQLLKGVSSIHWAKGYEQQPFVAAVEETVWALENLCESSPPGAQTLATTLKTVLGISCHTTSDVFSKRLSKRLGTRTAKLGVVMAVHHHKQRFSQLVNELYVRPPPSDRKEDGTRHADAASHPADDNPEGSGAHAENGARDADGETFFMGYVWGGSSASGSDRSTRDQLKRACVLDRDLAAETRPACPTAWGTGPSVEDLTTALRTRLEHATTTLIDSAASNEANELHYEFWGLDPVEAWNPGAPTYWTREAVELRALSKRPSGVVWRFFGVAAPHPWRTISQKQRNNVVWLRRLLNQEAGGDLVQTAEQLNLPPAVMHQTMLTGVFSKADFEALAETLVLGEERATWRNRFELTQEHRARGVLPTSIDHTLHESQFLPVDSRIDGVVAYVAMGTIDADHPDLTVDVVLEGSRNLGVVAQGLGDEGAGLLQLAIDAPSLAPTLLGDGSDHVFEAPAPGNPIVVSPTPVGAGTHRITLVDRGHAHGRVRFWLVLDRAPTPSRQVFVSTQSRRGTVEPPIFCTTLGDAPRVVVATLPESQIVPTFEVVHIAGQSTTQGDGFAKVEVQAQDEGLGPYVTTVEGHTCPSYWMFQNPETRASTSGGFLLQAEQTATLDVVRLVEGKPQPYGPPDLVQAVQVIGTSADGPVLARLEPTETPGRLHIHAKVSGLHAVRLLSTENTRDAGPQIEVRISTPPVEAATFSNPAVPKVLLPLERASTQARVTQLYAVVFLRRQGRIVIDPLGHSGTRSVYGPGAFGRGEAMVYIHRGDEWAYAEFAPGFVERGRFSPENDFGFDPLAIVNDDQQLANWVVIQDQLRLEGAPWGARHAFQVYVTKSEVAVGARIQDTPFLGRLGPKTSLHVPPTKDVGEALVHIYLQDAWAEHNLGPGFQERAHVDVGSLGFGLKTHLMDEQALAQWVASTTSFRIPTAPAMAPHEFEVLIANDQVSVRARLLEEPLTVVRSDGTLSPSNTGWVKAHEDDPFWAFLTELADTWTNASENAAQLLHALQNLAIESSLHGDSGSQFGVRIRSEKPQGVASILEFVIPKSETGVGPTAPQNASTATDLWSISGQPIPVVENRVADTSPDGAQTKDGSGEPVALHTPWTTGQTTLVVPQTNPPSNGGQPPPAGRKTTYYGLPFKAFQAGVKNVPNVLYFVDAAPPTEVFDPPTKIEGSGEDFMAYLQGHDGHFKTLTSDPSFGKGADRALWDTLQAGGGKAWVYVIRPPEGSLHVPSVLKALGLEVPPHLEDKVLTPWDIPSFYKHSAYPIDHQGLPGKELVHSEHYEDPMTVPGAQWTKTYVDTVEVTETMLKAQTTRYNASLTELDPPPLTETQFNRARTTAPTVVVRSTEMAPNGPYAIFEQGLEPAPVDKEDLTPDDEQTHTHDSEADHPTQIKGTIYAGTNVEQVAGFGSDQHEDGRAYAYFIENDGRILNLDAVPEAGEVGIQGELVIPERIYAHQIIGALPFWQTDPDGPVDRYEAFMPNPHYPGPVPTTSKARVFPKKIPDAAFSVEVSHNPHQSELRAAYGFSTEGIWTGTKPLSDQKLHEIKTRAFSNASMVLVHRQDQGYLAFPVYALAKAQGAKPHVAWNLLHNQWKGPFEVIGLTGLSSGPKETKLVADVFGYSQAPYLRVTKPKGQSGLVQYYDPNLDTFVGEKEWSVDPLPRYLEGKSKVEKRAQSREDYFSAPLPELFRQQGRTGFASPYPIPDAALLEAKNRIYPNQSVVQLILSGDEKHPENTYFAFALRSDDWTSPYSPINERTVQNVTVLGLTGVADSKREEQNVQFLFDQLRQLGFHPPFIRVIKKDHVLYYNRQLRPTVTGDLTQNPGTAYVRQLSKFEFEDEHVASHPPTPQWSPDVTRLSEWRRAFDILDDVTTYRLLRHLKKQGPKTRSQLLELSRLNPPADNAPREEKWLFEMDRKKIEDTLDELASLSLIKALESKDGLKYHIAPHTWAQFLYDLQAPYRLRGSTSAEKISSSENEAWDRIPYAFRPLSSNGDRGLAVGLFYLLSGHTLSRVALADLVSPHLEKPIDGYRLDLAEKMFVIQNARLDYRINWDEWAVLISDLETLGLHIDPTAKTPSATTDSDPVVDAIIKELPPKHQPTEFVHPKPMFPKTNEDSKNFKPTVLDPAQELSLHSGPYYGLPLQAYQTGKDLPPVIFVFSTHAERIEHQVGDFIFGTSDPTFSRGTDPLFKAALEAGQGRVFVHVLETPPNALALNKIHDFLGLEIPEGSAPHVVFMQPGTHSATLFHDNALIETHEIAASGRMPSAFSFEAFKQKVQISQNRGMGFDRPIEKVPMTNAELSVLANALNAALKGTTDETMGHFRPQTYDAARLGAPGSVVRLDTLAPEGTEGAFEQGLTPFRESHASSSSQPKRPAFVRTSFLTGKSGYGNPKHWPSSKSVVWQYLIRNDGRGLHFASAGFLGDGDEVGFPEKIYADQIIGARRLERDTKSGTIREGPLVYNPHFDRQERVRHFTTKQLGVSVPDPALSLSKPFALTATKLAEFQGTMWIPNLKKVALRNKLVKKLLAGLDAEKTGRITDSDLAEIATRVLKLVKNGVMTEDGHWSDDFNALHNPVLIDSIFTDLFGPLITRSAKNPHSALGHVWLEHSNNAPPRLMFAYFTSSEFPVLENWTGYVGYNHSSYEIDPLDLLENRTEIDTRSMAFDNWVKKTMGNAWRVGFMPWNNDGEGLGISFDFHSPKDERWGVEIVSAKVFAKAFPEADILPDGRLDLAYLLEADSTDAIDERTRKAAGIVDPHSQYGFEVVTLRKNVGSKTPFTGTVRIVRFYDKAAGAQPRFD